MIQQTSNTPLVSVCILAYNSEMTIIDTLDSVYNQNYNPLELIVSDDGSHDNTVTIVSKWLSSHKHRFFKSTLLNVKSNTGTPANCNRAFASCNGKWIKFIAADDCLLPNCISDDIQFVVNNKTIEVLYSDYYGFVQDVDGTKKIIEKRLNPAINEAFDTTPDKQVKFYLSKSFNISPSAFIKADVISKVGGFIEKYKVFEDTPFFTKVLLANIKIFHLPKYTVMYRIDTESVTRDINNKFFYKTKFVDNLLQFRKDMVYPLFPWYNFKFWINELSYRLQYFLTVRLLNNKRTKFNNLIYLILKALNPYYLLNKTLLKLKR